MNNSNSVQNKNTTASEGRSTPDSGNKKRVSKMKKTLRDLGYA